jgi:hypothetical protein
MKKSIRYTVTMSLLFMFIISFAYGNSDLALEGELVVEKSKFMLDEIQKLKDAKNPDRAWLSEQGQLINKQGMDALNSARVMRTLEGVRNMQRAGQMLQQFGNLLLNIGNQKGEVTPEENEKIIKQCDVLQNFGKFMLRKGQLMGGD